MPHRHLLYAIGRIAHRLRPVGVEIITPHRPRQALGQRIDLLSLRHVVQTGGRPLSYNTTLPIRASTRHINQHIPMRLVVGKSGVLPL